MGRNCLKSSYYLLNMGGGIACAHHMRPISICKAGRTTLVLINIKNGLGKLGGLIKGGFCNFRNSRSVHKTKGAFMLNEEQ